MQVRAALERIYRDLAEMDAVDLATRLALVLFLVSDWVAGEDWQFSLPLRLLALVGLVSPPHNRNPWLWLLIVAFVGAKTIANRWTQDNHLFLLTYFCLAASLALTQPQPARSLAAASKLLVGWCFAFAVLWKGYLSIDFMSGNYFYYTFMTDRRFQEMGTILAGMTPEMYEHNLQALRSLVDTSATVEVVTLQATEALRGMTRLVTWWTAAIEAWLAVAFLWPGDRGPARHRHLPLLLFAWTTYTTVTNVGVSFGWTLMILGAAQCKEDQRGVRVLYVATCCLLMVYHYAPVLSFVRNLVRG